MSNLRHKEVIKLSCAGMFCDKDTATVGAGFTERGSCVVIETSRPWFCFFIYADGKIFCQSSDSVKTKETDVCMFYMKLLYGWPMYSETNPVLEAYPRITKAFSEVFIGTDPSMLPASLFGCYVFISGFRHEDEAPLLKNGGAPFLSDIGKRFESSVQRIGTEGTVTVGVYLKEGERSLPCYTLFFNKSSRCLASRNVMFLPFGIGDDSLHLFACTVLDPYVCVLEKMPEELRGSALVFMCTYDGILPYMESSCFPFFLELFQKNCLYRSYSDIIGVFLPKKPTNLIWELKEIPFFVEQGDALMECFDGITAFHENTSWYENGIFYAASSIATAHFCHEGTWDDSPESFIENLRSLDAAIFSSLSRLFQKTLLSTDMQDGMLKIMCGFVYCGGIGILFKKEELLSDIAGRLCRFVRKFSVYKQDYAGSGDDFLDPDDYLLSDFDLVSAFNRMIEILMRAGEDGRKFFKIVSGISHVYDIQEACNIIEEALVRGNPI